MTTITLGSLFGVPIRLHFTFLLFLVFLLFVGVTGKQSAAGTVLYIIALFASVLLHELGHAVAARRYGIKTVEIVMYPIGGVARLDQSPRAIPEVIIALAGPLVNVIIATLIFGWLTYTNTPMPAKLTDVTDANLAHRVAAGNLVLALFNMLPAFPMDGGRVLRGLLATRKSDADATRIAAYAGQGFSILMGLYGLLSANFMLVFIAMFVYLGAAAENAAAQSTALTTGEPVSAAMITDFRTLSHGASLREAGDLLLATNQQDFPVVYGTSPLGLLTRAALMRALLNQGPDAFVSSAMDRDFTRLDPAMDLAQALKSFTGTCALVLKDDELVGMLTSENLSEFLILRQITSIKAKQETA